MKEKSVLALKLKRLRGERGINSSEIVADAIGVKRATYRRYEINSIPKRDTLLKIADYFNVSLDYLLSDELDEIVYKVGSDNVASSGDLTSFERYVINKVRTLDEKEIAELLHFLDGKGNK